MPHVTSFDPGSKILTVAVDGLWTQEDAKALDAELRQYLPLSDNRNLAVDLETALRFEGTEARRKTAQVLQEHAVTHLVVYNARPAVRILVKILLQLAGTGTKGRFFPSRGEAIAWLQQERQGK
jgi:hypothetical protein